MGMAGPVRLFDHHACAGMRARSSYVLCSFFWGAMLRAESEDMGQPMDGHRQVKSFERLVDSLVDLSVSSLVSSSLSRQHQQLANFGRASSQHRLIACA